MFQFFFLVEAPVSGMAPGQQFVPQQLLLLPAILGPASTCYRCKSQVSASWKFCPECGATLVCQSCGTRILALQKYCSNCGKILSS